MYNYDVSSWRSIKIRLFQTVVSAQKLQNLEVSNKVGGSSLNRSSTRGKTRPAKPLFFSSLFVQRDQSYISLLSPVVNNMSMKSKGKSLGFASKTRG